MFVMPAVCLKYIPTKIFSRLCGWMGGWEGGRMDGREGEWVGEKIRMTGEKKRS